MSVYGDRVKFAALTVVVLVCVIITMAFVRVSIDHVALSTKAEEKSTSAPDKRAPVRRPTSNFAMDMKIPVEVETCLNQSKPASFMYNFSSDFYLLPPKADMCKMQTSDLEALYQRYLSTIQMMCKRTLRFGHLKDGGWHVCVEHRYLPKGKCLVYSFGINNDFSFDDDIASWYQCEVHSFDPSMGKKSYVRKQNPRMYFHDTGVSYVANTQPVDGEWRMLTHREIRRTLGHIQRMPDVVKMDIEAWEWSVLPDMLSTGETPKQIIIEFHLWSQKYTSQRNIWIHRLWVLKDLYEAGYRVFWVNRNLICSFKSLYTKRDVLACHEISLIWNGPSTPNPNSNGHT